MELKLLPQPRWVRYSGEAFRLTDGQYVFLVAPQPQKVRFSAQKVQTALAQAHAYHWLIEAGLDKETPVANGQLGLVLRLDPRCELPEQGYRLRIAKEGLEIRATSEVGLFYGACTLSQIIADCGLDLPGLEIEDWPDFPARGVMIDISRDKVPTMETLKTLIDRLAGWKYNQVQLYTEHTFAYRQHQKVWANASPLTGEEILELDEFCRARFIELVPNQNSFGHFKRWLIHEPYQQLAEVTGEFEAPWGKEKGPNSLCPTDPRSLELVRGLYDELLPHFSSKMLNVGCDETFDLGQGRSKEACAQSSPSRVYLEYLLSLHADLTQRGVVMQFWGDIVSQHPELIPELPPDAIALEWGYEADHPYEQRCASYQAAGIPFYVCPGTSSWCSLAGRSENALANLRAAAYSGRKYGACGYLVTDWGDNGHWQPLPVSYLGLAAGAAYAWAYEQNEALVVAEVLDRRAFFDQAGVMGKLAYDLGNVYRLAGFEPVNTSVLFMLLSWSIEKIRSRPRILGAPYRDILTRIETLEARLACEEMVLPLAERALLRSEFRLVLHMLKHACWRGLLAQEKDSSEAVRLKTQLAADFSGLEAEFTAVWLSRNRPGGLADSLAKLQKVRADYAVGDPSQVVSSGGQALEPDQPQSDLSVFVTQN